MVGPVLLCALTGEEKRCAVIPRERGALVRVALIPGDGVGVEVVRQARKVLECAAAAAPLAIQMTEWDLGAERYLRTGVTIREDEFRALAEDCDAILLGALGDPRVPDDRHVRDVLLGLRRRLDLYVNYRPAVLPHPRLCPLRDMDGRSVRIEIFRENTEGAYVSVSVANPLAAIRCVALLVEYLGEADVANRVEDAALAAVAQGQTTPDLGGSLTTEEVGDWVCDALARSLAGREGAAGGAVGEPARTREGDP